MRRYKIVACILLIFSVFGFVLAAPAVVQEVREACADAVDGGDNVIIGSGKRAEDEEPLSAQPLPEQELTSSNSWSTPAQRSSTAPEFARMIQPSPSFSSGESKPPLLSTSIATELSWNPEGEAKLIQPGTSTEIQPASLSRAKSVKWGAFNEVKLPSGRIFKEELPPLENEHDPLSPGRGGYQPEQPTSLSKSKSISWPPSKEVHLPSGLIYSEMLQLENKPLPLQPGREGHQPGMVAQQSPSRSKPKSKNIFSKLGKLSSKLKFWRRFSGTADGVVTEG